MEPPAKEVKQKRPPEVANFLRTFHVEDRHEVLNCLALIGLQQFKQSAGETTLPALQNACTRPAKGDKPVMKSSPRRSNSAIPAQKRSVSNTTKASDLQRFIAERRDQLTSAVEATKQRSAPSHNEADGEKEVRKYCKTPAIDFILSSRTPPFPIFSPNVVHQLQLLVARTEGRRVADAAELLAKVLPREDLPSLRSPAFDSLYRSILVSFHAAAL